MVSVVQLAGRASGVLRGLGLKWVLPSLAVVPVAATFAWVSVYESVRGVSDAVLFAPPPHKSSCSLTAAVVSPLCAVALVATRLRSGLPPGRTSSAIAAGARATVAQFSISVLHVARFHSVTFVGSASLAAFSHSLMRRLCRKKSGDDH